MLVNDEYTADRDRRTGRAKGWKGPERRRIAPDAGGQLLEQGDLPAAAGTLEAQSVADDAPHHGDDRERRESRVDRRKNRPRE